MNADAQAHVEISPAAKRFSCIEHVAGKLQSHHGMVVVRVRHADDDKVSNFRAGNNRDRNVTKAKMQRRPPLDLLSVDCDECDALS